MKNILYSPVILALSVIFASCSKEYGRDLDKEIQNQELRAPSLGFSDVNAYKSSITEQCAAGNHENCDILNDGTHEACIYSEHAGTNHDGTHHNGTGHGTHNSNGHSHGNNSNGNHGNNNGHQGNN